MDYTQFAGPLLALAGAGLQWVRQYPRVHDSWIGVVAVLLATGAYALVHVPGPDIRLEIILALLKVGEYSATVLGGTFVAARAAAGGLAVVPRTNSIKEAS